MLKYLTVTLLSVTPIFGFIGTKDTELLNNLSKKNKEVISSISDTKNELNEYLDVNENKNKIISDIEFNINKENNKNKELKSKIENEKQRIKKEKEELEKSRQLEKERLEQEKLEKERLEQEKIDELEQEKLKEKEIVNQNEVISENDSETPSTQKNNAPENTYTGVKLTRSAGRINGPSGEETYYNLPMDGVISIARSQGIQGEYWVREDGVKMYGDYVMVAANLQLRPRGSLIQTSLGMGIVLDTGGFASGNPTQLDIATNW